MRLTIPFFPFHRSIGAISTSIARTCVRVLFVVILDTFSTCGVMMESIRFREADTVAVGMSVSGRVVFQCTGRYVLETWTAR